MSFINNDMNLFFKIVIIGDSGVGKSNIMKRYIDNEFSPNSKTTDGVEFADKLLEIERYNVKLIIWDTAGQERFKSIGHSYYYGSKGSLIVYDITRIETFQNEDKWVHELRNNGAEKVQIILIGNKCDLEQNRQVSKNLAEEKENLKKSQ